MYAGIGPSHVIKKWILCVKSIGNLQECRSGWPLLGDLLIVLPGTKQESGGGGRFELSSPDEVVMLQRDYLS